MIAEGIPDPGAGVFITRAGAGLLFHCQPSGITRDIAGVQDVCHENYRPSTTSTSESTWNGSKRSSLSSTPPTRVRDVEEVIFVDGGPVDYLAWFALDGYDDHTFFYYDDAPEKQMLRQLLGMMPNKSEMPKFRALLKSQYETFETVNSAALFEIPDTYMPQFTPRPRANIGFFYTPIDDAVAAGISAVPRTKEQRILEDVEKLLPSKDLNGFVNDVVQELYAQIEAEIEQHLIRADVRADLKADSRFQYETVTSIPDDLHPEYGGREAELWQKPVSKVSYLEGAQGFLQVWLPEEADQLALVTVTNGEYDAETVVEQTRDELRQTMVES